MSDIETKIRKLLQLARDPAGIIVAPGTLTDPQAFADTTGMEVHISPVIGRDHYYVLHRDHDRTVAVDRIVTPRNE